MRELVIDADAHITEPPDVSTSRASAKDKDRVPHVVVNDQGLEIWVLKTENGYKRSSTNCSGFWLAGIPEEPAYTFRNAIQELMMPRSD